VSLDPTLLFLSFIPSGVGLVLFIYGKKQSRLPQLVAGLLFLVYPYFVPSAGAMILVGVVLGAGLWWVLRLGW
jgi:hypothetical protein